MANQHYHVFLVHHGDDDALAQELAHRLKAQGINPWVYS